MALINSVLGPLDSAALGFTLMHEHLQAASPGIIDSFPELLGPDYMGRIVAGLKEDRREGIATIVDATTFDLGRDVKVMAEASRQSGVNIICCTGSWRNIQWSLCDVPADRIAALFVREIREGIGGTGIKAGIIKAASDFPAITREEENILRAVARAHLETRAPIMLHSYAPAQVGKQQVAILKQEGVNLTRVKVDHCADTTDVEYLAGLMDQGCYLGFDRFPVGMERPDRDASPLARARTLKALIAAGYAERLLPSHDWALVLGQSSPSPEERQRMNPHGHLYMKRVLFSQLREMGVTEAVVNSLCTDNPRRFFEGF